MGEQTVESDGDAEPRERIGDREHDQIAPAQRASPGAPGSEAQQRRRQRCCEDVRDMANPIAGRLWAVVYRGLLRCGDGAPKGRCRRMTIPTRRLRAHRCCVTSEV